MSGQLWGVFEQTDEYGGMVAVHVLPVTRTPTFTSRVEALQFATHVIDYCVPNADDEDGTLLCSFDHVLSPACDCRPESHPGPGGIPIYAHRPPA